MKVSAARLAEAATVGIASLRAAVIRRPPSGMTSEEAAQAFSRLEAPIAGALRAMLQKIADAVPCSVCRKPRGTNLVGCDRCRSFELMRLEKESPSLRAKADAEDEELKRSLAQAAALDEARLAALRGRKVRVALVGCGREKAPSAREARNLYRGNLFRAARRVAEHHCDDWVILSAGHGVVLPEQIIQPYDATLQAMRMREREDWARRVSSVLRARYRGLDIEYVGLAGNEYLANLTIGPLRFPLDRLMMGQRLRRLKAMDRDGL